MEYDKGSVIDNTRSDSLIEWIVVTGFISRVNEIGQEESKYILTSFNFRGDTVYEDDSYPVDNTHEMLEGDTAKISDDEDEWPCHIQAYVDELDI